VVRWFLVLLLFVAGCVTRTAADSCKQKHFSGGVLQDCGDVAEFEPIEPKASAYVMGSPSRAASNPTAVDP